MQMEAILLARPSLAQSLSSYAEILAELDGVAAHVAAVEAPILALDAFRNGAPGLWSAMTAVAGMTGTLDALLDGAGDLVDAARSLRAYRSGFDGARAEYEAAWAAARASPTEASLARVAAASRVLASSFEALGARLTCISDGLARAAELSASSAAGLESAGITGTHDISASLRDLSASFAEPLEQLRAIQATLSADRDALRSVAAEATRR